MINYTPLHPKMEYHEKGGENTDEKNPEYLVFF